MPQATQDNPLDLAALSEMELFALARTLESQLDMSPKIGDENRPSQTKLRFGQSSHLGFASNQVNDISLKDGKVNIDIRGFGMFGPNGALPIHISEQIYEKKHHQKNTTFNDFVNIFHHRLTSMFYKAWREAQDVPSLDDKDSWQFSRFIASLAGMADHKDYNPDVPVYARMYYARYLQNKSNPVDNLRSIIKGYFNVNVEIQENIGQWIDASEFSTHLSRNKKNRLGNGLMLGSQFFDATQKFRIVIGPISSEKYLQFLKGGRLAKQLIMWVEQFVHYEYQWDVELIVDKNKISQQPLGRGIALGYTSWLGQPQQHPRVVVEY